MYEIDVALLYLLYPCELLFVYCEIIATFNDFLLYPHCYIWPICINVFLKHVLIFSYNVTIFSMHTPILNVHID